MALLNGMVPKEYETRKKSKNRRLVLMSTGAKLLNTSAKTFDHCFFCKKNLQSHPFLMSLNFKMQVANQSQTD